MQRGFWPIITAMALIVAVLFFWSIFVANPVFKERCKTIDAEFSHVSYGVAICIKADGSLWKAPLKE